MFFSVPIPFFVIISCAGLIFRAVRRMKKAKELYLISKDLVPPPEVRNKRIITLSAVAIFVSLADYAIVPMSNAFAMFLGIIVIFVAEIMEHSDKIDGYTGKQNRYRITKISAPLPWDYGENGENTFVVDKKAGAYWVNYEKDRIRPEDYKVDIDLGV
jgi:hypothetical protein